MTYQRLLEITAAQAPVLSANVASPVFNEIEIQSRWFSGNFSREHLSNHGQNVTIVSPGEWNRGAGPDFLAATIEIDGVTFHGPIELDLDSRNWELHGHNQSEFFDDVILHIVLQDCAPTYFTRTSNHRDVPRIVLSPDEVNAALGRPRLNQGLARPGLCLTPLAEMPEAEASALLKESALHRAQRKATRFEQTANLHSFSQALWEALADALGFSANRLPLRLLAQRLPVKKLNQHTPEDREAILFGTAGFLSPTLHETAPPDSQEWLEDIWTRWWKHRLDYEFPTNRNPAWSTRATRPGNHPQRRLAALAAAAAQWNSLSSLARQAPPFTNFSKALAELNEPFWDHHHTLQSNRTEKPIKLLGKSRLEEFLINTLYPLNLENWDAFAKVRAAAPNQKVKRCCERLFGSLEKAKPYLKFAWQHQALLQVYQDFCLEDLSDCADCPFPSQLAQWKPTPSHD
ncbi:MAG: DUF2851 family protein [Akkermansiaceae bacterium]|nr:DUF2851 family protein [Akkermansiaceae bacterium]